MAQLLGFDPLKFLNLENIKDQDKDSVSKNLQNKISQYILIRVAELLPENEVKKSKNPEDLFSLAKTSIPDLSSKVRLFLEDFKKEFYNNLKK